VTSNDTNSKLLLTLVYQHLSIALDIISIKNYVLFIKLLKIIIVFIDSKNEVKIVKTIQSIY
jgi:hypothetical protein